MSKFITNYITNSLHSNFQTFAWFLGLQSNHYSRMCKYIMWSIAKKKKKKKRRKKELIIKRSLHSIKRNMLLQYKNSKGFPCIDYIRKCCTSVRGEKKSMPGRYKGDELKLPQLHEELPTATAMLVIIFFHILKLQMWFMLVNMFCIIL